MRRLRLFLGSVVGVVAAVTLGSGAASAREASGLLVKLSSFSGTATYGVDLGPESMTPIFFTEQVTWKLIGATQRRVKVSQTVMVPVRVTIKGAAHGQYAVIDQTGQVTSLVPYDCTSALARTQRASLRLTHRPSGANRLTFALIRPDGLDAGGATCTDKDQAETLSFPTGSKWLAAQLGYWLVASQLGTPISRITRQHQITHGCGSTPPCVERLQFESRVKFTVTR
jgi:hypothetical protein